MAGRILVAGLGNILMSDDGIGPYLVCKTRDLSPELPDVEFVDAGSGGMALLHLIACRDKVILIDCAKMGKKPGTIKRFTPDDVLSTKSLSHFSLHETDVLKILAMSVQLGECPGEVVIFGIEPACIEPGRNLSDELLKNQKHYIELIRDEIDNSINKKSQPSQVGS
jgi:hydrogenase maturation protease